MKVSHTCQARDAIPTLKRLCITKSVSSWWNMFIGYMWEWPLQTVWFVLWTLISHKSFIERDSKRKGLSACVLQIWDGEKCSCICRPFYKHRCDDRNKNLDPDTCDCKGDKHGSVHRRRPGKCAFQTNCDACYRLVRQLVAHGTTLSVISSGLNLLLNIAGLSPSPPAVVDLGVGSGGSRPSHPSPFTKLHWSNFGQTEK